MNFFASIFGKKLNEVPPNRETEHKTVPPTIFLTQEEHLSHKATITATAANSIPTLKSHGYHIGESVELEYFFLTNTDLQAHELSESLIALDYDSEFGILEGSDLFLVKGKSTPIELSGPNLSSWVSEMCDLGFRHDCKLDSFSIPEIASAEQDAAPNHSP
ncbi:hypothetical protein ACFPK9_00655 [Rubritalea spongiae]|uniref:DUF4265 domain-containing protein n=1 Tax=Rubritalea spongiae TaxID=430797 RepID=A0ABW5E539_9BACT